MLQNKNWLNAFLATLATAIITVYPQIEPSIRTNPWVEQNTWILPLIGVVIGLLTKFYKTEPETPEDDTQD